MAPLRPQPTLLREVEQKFAFSAALVPRVLANAGSPPFRSFILHPPSTIHDTYYDTPDRLLTSHPTSPIWLRTRNGVWEAKVTVPTGERGGGQAHAGGYRKVAYEEHSASHSGGFGRIVEMVRARGVKGWNPNQSPNPDGARAEPGSKSMAADGLITICDFVTDRRAFQADGRFEVVLDSMDFGHHVGEVELLVAHNENKVDEPVDGPEHDPGTYVQRLMQQAHADITQFMREYMWFFESGEKGVKPKGKMTAYFEMLRARERKGVGNAVSGGLENERAQAASTEQREGK
ncbi:CYTH-like domain-containing protein [Kalaharituber pfeilii]|nr:CYTH-like domain-containing protein [Kalaharituber pfeilii]